MSVKDQVLAIAERLKAAPADAIIKVVMVFVKPALGYWEAETLRQTKNPFPEGSEERKVQEKKYSDAFVQWHRLNCLYTKIEEAEKFKSFDDPRFSPKQKKPMVKAEQVEAEQ